MGTAFVFSLALSQDQHDCHTPALGPFKPRAAKIFNEREIAGIREACRIGRLVLDAAHAAVRPGVTTDEIDRVVSPHRLLQCLLPKPCSRKAGHVFEWSSQPASVTAMLL